MGRVVGLGGREVQASKVYTRREEVRSRAEGRSRLAGAEPTKPAYEAGQPCKSVQASHGAALPRSLDPPPGPKWRAASTGTLLAKRVCLPTQAHLYLAQAVSPARMAPDIIVLLACLHVPTPFCTSSPAPPCRQTLT